MTDIKNIEVLLERIAIALETIAINCTIVIPNPVSNGDEAAAELFDQPASDEETIPAHLGVIGSFLEARDISIKCVPPEDAADSVINSIALFMGERYRAIEGTYRKIKRTMQTGGTITESLAKETQVNVSSICQWCSRLHEIAFLEQYTYLKSPQFIIKAKTTTLPKALNFLSGQWLERYVLEKIKSAVTKASEEIGVDIHSSSLVNPQVTLPNGNDFELDVIYEVSGVIYWVEAKTGDYQQHIRKYSSVAKIMNLDCKHSIMLLTDISESASSSLSALFSMTVCAIEQFETYFLEILLSDIRALPND